MTNSSLINEIVTIIKCIESKTNEYNYSKDLSTTRTLSKCMLTSISSMIEAACCIAQRKKIIASRVLVRSILEHIVDMRYIVMKNDKSLNSKFVNYYKLFLYWEKEDLENENAKQEIPRIKREYEAYVFDQFPEQVERAGAGADRYAPEFWNKINKSIKDKYRNGWSGLTFHDRVREIETASGGCEPALRDLKKYFKYLSQYTHPTVYSCVPHFDPRNCCYQLAFDYSRIDARACQDFLFPALEYAVRSFGMIQGKDFPNNIYEVFLTLVRNSTNLRPLLSS